MRKVRQNVAAAQLHTALCWAKAKASVAGDVFFAYFSLDSSARATTLLHPHLHSRCSHHRVSREHPPLPSHTHERARARTQLAQFDWWLLRGGDGHHPARAGAAAATMPGRTLHQGAGMEEEGVVDQQQAECGQVRCTVVT